MEVRLKIKKISFQKEIKKGENMKKQEQKQEQTQEQTQVSLDYVAGKIGENIKHAMLIIAKKASNTKGFNLVEFENFIKNANVNVLNTQAKSISSFAKIEYNALYKANIKADLTLATAPKATLRLDNIDIYPHAVASFKQSILLTLSIIAMLKNRKLNSKNGSYNQASIDFLSAFGITATIRRNGSFDSFTVNNDKLINIFKDVRKDVTALFTHIDGATSLQKLNEKANKPKKESKGYSLPSVEKIQEMTAEQLSEFQKALLECLQAVNDNIKAEEEEEEQKTA